MAPGARAGARFWSHSQDPGAAGSPSRRARPAQIFRGRAVNTIDLVLSRLDGVRRARRGWLARCPAHPDRSPSLSIAEGTARRVLLFCHAGCGYQQIAAALEIEHGQSRKPELPPLVEARLNALEAERRADERRAPYRELMAAALAYKMSMRYVLAARAGATAAGPCSPGVWDLLKLAAAEETHAEAAVAGTSRS